MWSFLLVLLHLFFISVVLGSSLKSPYKKGSKAKYNRKYNKPKIYNSFRGENLHIHSLDEQWQNFQDPLPMYDSRYIMEHNPMPFIILPTQQHHAFANSGDSTSLYVGELHPDVSEDHIYQVFSQVGPVATIRLCRDLNTRRSLGYAYVNFYSSDDSERAFSTLNFVPILGRPCRIMWSQRNPEKRRSGAGNVFIKNLERTITSKTLYDTFIAFGNILSCKVVVDQDGESRGFGFVHFEEQEAADECIAKVNGMLMNGKQVYVGPHIPRKERQIEDLTGDNFTKVFFKNLEESTDE